MVKKTVILCIFNCSFLCLLAQTDTIRSKKLREFTVVAERVNTYNCGGKTEKPDSLLRTFYLSSSMASLMEIASGLNVRTYGPGILATSSLRGGSAQQTNIIWNGVMLNNQATGLVDLNLIPSFLFENASVLPGLSGGLQGSGSLGGGIHLQNDVSSLKGNSFALMQSLGSFNNLSTGLKFNHGREKFHSETKCFYQQAQNNFPFYNISESGHPKQETTNARLSTFSVLQENTINTVKAGQFKLSYWGMFANRQIPPTMLMTESKAKQEDAGNKLMFNWNTAIQQLGIKLKILAQSDKLNYIDEEQNILSHSKTNSLLTELEGRIKTSARSQSSLGLTHLQAVSFSDEYLVKATRIQTSFWLNHAHQFPQLKTKIDLSLRQEIIDSKVIPLIPGIGLKTSLSPYFNLFGQVNRLYRFPTLNDLYWNPGGDPDLKPESGFGYEFSLQWHTKHSMSSKSITATGYYRSVTDMIQWQPLSTQIWIPVNIGSVENKGIELRINLNRHLSKHINLMCNVNADISRSKNSNKEDINFGKQLIYIPYYKYSGMAGVVIKKTSIIVSGIISGERFITPDNETKLPPFYILNLGLKRDIMMRTVQGNLIFRLNNILNYTYQTIAWRPMPGIHGEAGLHFNFIKQIKKANK